MTACLGMVRVNRAKERKESQRWIPEGSGVPFQGKDGDDTYPISTIKIQMPTFNGLDPLGWLMRAEQYFQINQTSERSKLQLVLVCMEDTTLHSVRWLEDCIPSLTWSQLRKQLLCRYAGEMTVNPYEFLATTK